MSIQTKGIRLDRAEFQRRIEAAVEVAYIHAKADIERYGRTMPDWIIAAGAVCKAVVNDDAVKALVSDGEVAQLIVERLCSRFEDEIDGDTVDKLVEAALSGEKGSDTSDAPF